MDNIEVMDNIDPKQSYSEEFSVSKNLIGLVVGGKGSNLKRIRSLKGITEVHFNNKKLTFKIEGYNEEIVKIARQFLEYNEQDICITRNLSDILEHDNGNLIQNIVYESGLVRAEIIDEDIDKPRSKQSEFVSLKFIGTIYSIDEAKACIKRVCTSQILKTSNTSSTFRTNKTLEEELQYDYSEQFRVTSNLVGLAIGKNGVRIQDVKKIQGIGKIDRTDGDGFTEFTVYGNSYEAVKEARKMLEMVEDITYIPPNKAGLIIGNKGSTITNIMSKTKVCRIEVKDKNRRDSDGYVPVVIIGHPDQIEVAKICIKSKIPDII